MPEPLALHEGLTVSMSAHNEAHIISRSLGSVRGLAREIVVVDSASTDNTAELAREYADRVIEAPNRLMLNVNKNLAIDAATSEWILILDPDEIVTPELARELVGIVETNDRAFDGYWIPRRDYELGREVHAGRSGPSLQLRLIRNGRGRFPCRGIHEMVTLEGTADRLTGSLDHWPRQSVWEYAQKRNLYSEHRAAELYRQRVPFRIRNLLLRPPAAFLKAYIARNGWRDGVPGLVIAVSAFYGTFLQDAKLWQLWERGAPVDPAAPLAQTSPGARSTGGCPARTSSSERAR